MPIAVATVVNVDECSCEQLLEMFHRIGVITQPKYEEGKVQFDIMPVVYSKNQKALEFCVNVSKIVEEYHFVEVGWINEDPKYH